MISFKHNTFCHVELEGEPPCCQHTSPVISCHVTRMQFLLDSDMRAVHRSMVSERIAMSTSCFSV